jgi:hypothetical protein
MLKDDVQTVVTENSPCIVLAVHLGPSETRAGGPPDYRCVVHAQMGGAHPDDVLSGLVGLKAGYSRVVEMVAQMMGMPDQAVHNDINRHLNEKRIREVDGD